MIYKKEIGVRTAARVYSDVVVPGLRNGEFFGNGLEIIGGRPGFSYYFFMMEFGSGAVARNTSTFSGIFVSPRRASNENP